MVSPQRRAKSHGSGVACALFRTRHIKAIPPFNGQYALHILMTVGEGGGCSGLSFAPSANSLAPERPRWSQFFVRTARLFEKSWPRLKTRKLIAITVQNLFCFLLQPNLIWAAAESDAGERVATELPSHLPRCEDKGARRTRLRVGDIK